MTRELFDDLIGEPPASTVDVHTIVRREKRRRWLPATALSAAAAVLAVAVGVTAAVSGGGGGTPASSESAPATGFRLVVDTQESADATKERLAAALDAALAKVAPDVEWEGGKPFGLEADPDNRIVFNGSGRLHTEGRTGMFVFSAENVESGPCVRYVDTNECVDDGGGAPLTCDPSAADCTKSTGPNGLPLVTQTYRFGSIVYANVQAEVEGGFVLSIEAQNATGEKVYQADPVLSLEQVTSIVNDLAAQIRK